VSARIVVGFFGQKQSGQSEVEKGLINAGEIHKPFINTRLPCPSHRERILKGHKKIEAFKISNGHKSESRRVSWAVELSSS